MPWASASQPLICRGRPCCRAVSRGRSHRPSSSRHRIWSTPGVGYAPGYCDPWWYVCYPGAFVPVENIVGERSSTDFGMSVGGGARFGVLFAELRYHYIWGPTIEAQNPTVNPLETPGPTDSLIGRKANSQFLMTTFGVRF